MGSNNSAHEHHSQDESPDGDDTGSPLFRNGSGSKRANAAKTKRNARQQDQNKQVWHACGSVLHMRAQCPSADPCWITSLRHWRLVMLCKKVCKDGKRESA